MKNYESILIGHTTLDTNIDHLGNSVDIVGGAVIYSSASAYALGHNVLVITKVAEKDKDRLKSFTIPSENVINLPTLTSTTMRNQYLTPDKERRICHCTEMGEGFCFEDIPQGVKADVIHFAGLLYGDFDGEMMRKASELAPIAVDVQALLRHKKEDGSMFFEDWSDKRKYLPYITYLKTDAAEAEILTGLTDRYEAAKLLYSWGAKEVLITHNTEVIVYDGRDFYSCPIRARNLSGRTGRGDTTFSAYLVERKQGIAKALLYATATVSLKMETPGPLKCKREDIDAYIEEFYADYLK